MHGCIGIVAVGVISHITRRLIACVRGYRGITVSIAIGIAIPNRSNVAFINLPIAVIIDPITHFSCARVHGCVGIIAVRVVSYIARGL
jgi:hypothetical protein